MREILGYSVTRIHGLVGMCFSHLVPVRLRDITFCIFDWWFIY